jgi:UDP-glucose 4-epimerase
VVEKVTNRSTAINYKERRKEEIERLAINSHLAQRELDWRLQYPQLEYMIESAINWLKNHGEW